MLEKWGFKFGKLVSKVHPKDIACSWKIFKGDEVQVIAGKCKGEKGKVIAVRRKYNLVYVEGLNIARKHVASSPLGPGSIYSIEQGITLSNLALIDPVHKTPTKVKWETVVDDQGLERKVRISKLSGKEIPRPGVETRKREHSEFSTTADEVSKVTFIPSLDSPPIPDGCWL